MILYLKYSYKSAVFFLKRILWYLVRFRKKAASQPKLQVHLLVVKKIDYVNLAKTCVLSFFFYNRNAAFVFHCDKITIEQLKQKMRLWRFLSGASLAFELCDSTQSWQDSKLEILLKIVGTPDLFLDADLLWHGPFPTKEGILFLVREFNLEDNKKYFPLLNKLPHYTKDPYSMKNTSCFSWNGADPNNLDQSIANVRFCVSEFLNEMKDKESKIEITRICEQLILSVLVDYFSETKVYLKDWDKLGDGQFVESSYFGATGSRFVPWGISSRRFRAR